MNGSSTLINTIAKLMAMVFCREWDKVLVIYDIKFLSTDNAVRNESNLLAALISADSITCPYVSIVAQSIYA